MAETIPIVQPKEKSSRAGYTLAEILIVIVLMAIMASLVLPRLLPQSEKMNAAEAVSIMGSIKRMEFQARDEDPNNAFFLFDDACANLVALQDRGLDLTDACGANQRWTFSVEAGPIIAAYRGVAADDGPNSITLDLTTNAWNGTGAFAPGTANWPNLD